MSESMNTDRFESLLAAYIEGALEDAEVRELHAAVHTSQEYRQQFREASRLNVLLRETMTEQVELSSLSKTVNPAAPNLVSRWRWAGILAATILAALSIGFFANRWNTKTPLAMGVCMSVAGGRELSVRRGEEILQAKPDFQFCVGDEVTCDTQTKAIVRLSGGSILSMNVGSQIVLVSDRPQVRLTKGEAFFEISPRKDAMPAFEVLTGHSTIAVMGTVFSLAATARTDVKVYEGSVQLIRHSDQASVNVQAQQMANSESLAVETLSTQHREFTKLLPTDDLTLDNGISDQQHDRLKVEGKRRTVYLRFEIPDLAGIQSAKLRLKQDVDSGSGTLRFFVGSHSDWNEQDLNADTAPQARNEVAQHRGVVGGGEVVEVEIDASHLRPGPLTIVMTLDATGENDIWFSSRESDSPPELVIDRIAGRSM